MINNIKKSFDILFKNSAVMQPLILFILFLLIFNMFMGRNVLINPSLGIIFVILSVLLFSAFLSGWLYMIKYAVDNYKGFDKNDPKYIEKIGNYNIETCKKFFIGVGEYFIPVIITVILSMVISKLLLYGGQKLLNINDLNFIINGLSAQSIQELPQINLRQMAFLLYIDLVTFMFHFFTLFWMPEIFYKTKNTIFAFFKSIVFLFKNFLTSIGLFFFLFFCFFVFMIISFITSIIPFLPLIMFLIFLYLVSYSTILIFMTYKTINIKREIEEINSKDVFIKSQKEDNNAF